MKYSALAVLICLAGGLTSFATPAQAYTINTTEVGKRIRWATDTVSLQMDSEYQRFLSPGQSYSALAMGFDAWRGLPRVPDLVIRPGLPASVGHHDGHATNGIYLLRAITEERHLLLADNGYAQYMAGVRWRFIPGVV